MELFASYTGAGFLVFYVVMLATCVFAGLWIPANLRPAGKRRSVTEIEDIAVLAGGSERHATALLANLFAQGGLQQESANRVRVARSDLDVGEAEKTILQEIGALKLAHVKATLGGHALDIEEGLIERGLLMDQGERLQLRVLSTLPYIALLILAIYRQQAGEAAGEPTGFLVFLIILTFLFGTIRFARLNPRTKAGNDVLRDLETQSSRLRSAPQAKEAGNAVAIFGTGVLVGTPWEPVHAMRQWGGGEGGGTSGDGDGGGGCGGGCGGCGG